MDKLVERTIYRIDRIYCISKKYVSSFNNICINKIETLLAISILERIIGNLNSTKILLSKIENDPDVEPAIGLILRNNLSLCKIILKHTELKNNNEDLKIFYKSIFGENIQRTIKYVNKSHTKKELQSILDIIKNKFGFILRETGLNLDSIENEKLNFNIILPPKFNNLENLFTAYSKYEHFGLNTLILQSNNNENEIFERINNTIDY